MTIIVETGSIVANANSFVTLADTKSYASLHGVTLPADDSAIEVLIINAVSYLQSLEDKMKGERVSGIDQPLCYPRQCVVIYGTEFAIDSIPVNLKMAQMQLVCDQANGVKLFVDDTQGFAIKREKVGPLDTEYATGQAQSRAPSALFQLAMTYLKPLLVGSGFGLSTLRV